MTPQATEVSVLSKFLRTKEGARAAHLKHDYPTLENQTESLINEFMSLTSIDDSSVKLTRVGK